MNWAEVVVLIVVVVTAARFAHTRYGTGRETYDDRGARQDGQASAAENQLLRDELKAMKARLAVLERLATDDNDSGARLDREIDRLRDRDTL